MVCFYLFYFYIFVYCLCRSAGGAHQGIPVHSHFGCSAAFVCGCGHTYKLPQQVWQRDKFLGYAQSVSAGEECCEITPRDTAG